MTAMTALRAHLLADASIAALVGARVFPNALPQDTDMPAIVLTKVSGWRYAQLRGPASLARPRVQVDSWDTTQDGAVALGALCRQRLEGYAGTWSDGGSPAIDVLVAIQFDDEREMFEADILGGFGRHSADYFVFHQTHGGAL